MASSDGLFSRMRMDAVFRPSTVFPNDICIFFSEDMGLPIDGPAASARSGGCEGGGSSAVSEVLCSRAGAAASATNRPASNGTSGGGAGGGGAPGASGASGAPAPSACTSGCTCAASLRVGEGGSARLIPSERFLLFTSSERDNCE
mmetsp:Transcript_38125/g.120410  ORF Transcript_38125/g.120410 Transcript_38125/m.120410 type:complete len:146 (+) Transcript_38125:910-1347(+)